MEEDREAVLVLVLVTTEIQLRFNNNTVVEATRLAVFRDVSSHLR